MTLLTIDFETYYDDDYSLRKLTTEEYIRNALFEVIGVSVQVDGGQPQWFSGDFQSTHLWLSQFDWANSAACAHNAVFDMAILNWRFGIKPGMILDTLSMGRALVGQESGLSLAALSERFGLGVKGHEVDNAKGKRRAHFTAHDLAQYGAYCCNDSALTYKLLQKLYPLLPSSELRLIDWTIRAFSEPVLVANTQILGRELQQFRIRKQTMLRDLGVQDPAELRSDGQLAHLLMQCGVAPPFKESPKQKNPDGTPKIVWAFSRQDIEFMDLLEDPDERVAALVEARLAVKTSIVESRLERLLGISQRGYLPFPLAYYGAGTTGRFGGTEKINMQNPPRNKHLPDGTIQYSAIRQATQPPPGHYMLAGDLSQIELRTNAWQSGQEDILEILRNNGDVYSHAATKTFGYTVNKKTHPNERFVGKTQELGCGYGCGGPKFHHMLKVASKRENIPLADDSPEFAQRAVDVYRESHRAIKKFWDAADDVIPIMAIGGAATLGPYQIQHGRVLLPNGMTLYYPELQQRWDTDRNQWQWSYYRRKGRAKVLTSLYGGKLVENITQAVARVVMTDAMLRVMQRFRVVGTVHDELICVIPNDVDPADAKAYVSQCMTVVPAWAQGLPLACEVDTGPNYAECK